MASLLAGTVATLRNDLVGADALLADGITALRTVGDRAYMLSGLLTLAWVQARLGDPHTAARLLGASEALRAATGSALALVNRHTRDIALGAIEERLTAAQIQAEIAAGRAMSLDQAIAAAIRAGPIRPGGRRSTSTGQSITLTRREREVAELIARGATDREVAAALSIAVSTAGVHVHHILSKLGLDSRRQVGEWLAADESAPAPPA
jgi:DNA-binding CsgD family transcriptional regulator